MCIYYSLQLYFINIWYTYLYILINEKIWCKPTVHISSLPRAHTYSPHRVEYYYISTCINSKHSNTQIGTINEPPLPRRKKCPELAYKTHEFITCDQRAQRSNDLVASVKSSRARVSVPISSYFLFYRISFGFVRIFTDFTPYAQRDDTLVKRACNKFIKSYSHFVIWHCLAPMGMS